MSLIKIRDLHVKVNGTQVLSGVNLEFDKGKVYAVLGPNASGKSTLARTLMGFPEYKITAGDILFNGNSIINTSITKRAKMGLAYAFQHPPVIKGVKLRDLVCLTCAHIEHDHLKRIPGDPDACFPQLVEGFEQLNITNLSDRDLNDGFSGGEAKRSELFQVLCMNPKVMILDEPDSGLDYDSLRLVGKELKLVHDKTDTTMIIITHHRYILEYLQADRIDILNQGVKAYTGSMRILPKLEELGYESFLKHHGDGT